MKFPSSFLALSLSLMISQTLNASLIFNDNFVTGANGYTADANLYGQNPSTSTGFSGSWTNSNTSVYRASTTNLSMSGVSNSGGSLVANYQSFNQTRNDTRAFTNTSSSNVLWLSSLASFSASTLANTGSSGGSFFTGILSGNLPTYSASGTTAASWSTDNGGSLSGFAFGIRNGSLRLSYQTGLNTVSSVTLTPSFSLTADTTYLFVFQLEINASGNDVLNVWVLNSAVANQEALGAPTASITTANILASSSDLDVLAYYSAAPFNDSNGSVPASTTWDAVRMGTTFADLAVVPEPSGMALAMLGTGVVFLGLRRRLNRN